MGLLKPSEGVRTAPRIRLHRAVSPLSQWSTAKTPSNEGDPQNPNGSIPVRHSLHRAAKSPYRLSRYHEDAQAYRRERLPSDRNRCLGRILHGRWIQTNRFAQADTALEAGRRPRPVLDRRRMVERRSERTVPACLSLSVCHNSASLTPSPNEQRRILRRPARPSSPCSVRPPLSRPQFPAAASFP